MNVEASSPEMQAALELEKQKQAKLTEWWAAKDAVQNGAGLTSEDFGIVIDAMPTEVVSAWLQAAMSYPVLQDLPLHLATAFNAVKHLMGQGAKDKIAAEMALRKEVVALFFPSPKEGTNNAELPANWKLKYTHKIDRKVDEAAIDAVKIKLREMQVNPDPLLRTLHEVAVTEYKSLIQINPAAAKVFESALIIKPGSPTLELVPPKEKKGEAS